MAAPHFLQDGGLCHASKRIKDFLAEQPFKVIDWPGNSSDLNPIENCWNHMKNLLKKKDISSIPKLTL
jgi:transposase